MNGLHPMGAGLFFVPYLLPQLGENKLHEARNKRIVCVNKRMLLFLNPLITNVFLVLSCVNRTEGIAEAPFVSYLCTTNTANL